ncbi:carbamate kinase [Iamia sp. SCSIO 61187]|uniref:carbamate kinase n=1 Tax=Iamia sp. SCSIO 61187 TaxID=2722752 RepID=UPI001C62B441|nr:carbamate kinase [Iamia sp. SCSIO 61187]QYG93501.1 carbamate kinase [Iamia sp. SCSIO 61187]
MRIVFALGGNALLERGQPPDAAVQEGNILRAVAALAPMARHHEVVITHGNGPQVGLLARETSHDADLARPYPFDALGAETQGLIGYWLQQHLGNALPGRHVVALVTQTVVDADDPGFAHPTKPIGPVMDEATARRVATEEGWAVAPDGPWWRRVVASPEPRSIVELPVVEHLMRASTIVICAGGGGVPVVRDAEGRRHGVEAVVDKDLTAGVMAERLGADRLILLTDVPAVELDHGTPDAQALHHVTAGALRAHDFAAGSMGPKVDAACRFVERTGQVAGIGALEDAAALVDGRAGTVIWPSEPTPQGARLVPALRRL